METEAPSTEQHVAVVKCVAFAGQSLVASGDLPEVALAAKKAFGQDHNIGVIILDAETSFPVDVDLSGTLEDVAARMVRSTQPAVSNPPTRPGRPRLGVVAREVTLLPRHWEWLSEQPGGASVTLRKLVEEARRSTVGETRIRRAQESCYRFMSILAGDEPGYEEALRSLYAGDEDRFASYTEAWPPDVREHARRLARSSFEG